MILRNLGILSCGKMLGAVGVGVGLALGGFVLLLTVAMKLLRYFTSYSAMPDFAIAPPTDALFMVLFVPVAYGVIGFAAGIVGAFSYNLFSSRLGGIELDLVPPGG